MGVSTPGKVTGGGRIDPTTGAILDPAIVLEKPNGGGGNSKANFGFVIQFKSGAPAPMGNLVYDDKADGVRVKATSYMLLVIGPGTCGPDTHALFTGTAEVNGAPESLKVEVDDCGEPGTADTFSIQTDTYGASGVLISGNIQIHKGDFSSAAADTDGDSFGRSRDGSPLFGDDREFDLGTNPGQACAATARPNDEPTDPNPLDTNDDGFTDISDVVSEVRAFGESQTPSNKRYDLNLDGFIDIGDISLMTESFGEACVSPGPLG